MQFLTCNNNSIESLDALRGMRLRHLRCEHNRIDDLEPLRGMSLEHLDLTGNRVSDLEPLRGMGISILHLEYNAISDLGPLQGMPASRFLLNGNRISDLSPLAHSPIHAINVADNPLGNLGQLLQHPPLVVHLPHTLDQALLTAAIAAWPDHASPGRNARLIELLRRNDLAQLREAICPSGSQYGLLPIWHSYPEAKAVAGRMGGHLLCLESPGEEAAVGELLATHEFGSSPIWLGCEIDEGQGRWVTGTSLDPQRFPLRTHDSGVLRLSPSDDRSWLMTHPIDVERCVAAVVIEFPPPQP